MAEVHIRLESLPDDSILSPWFLQARDEERSVLHLFDPLAGTHLHAELGEQGLTPASSQVTYLLLLTLFFTRLT